jgi:hypothetical protein
MRGVTAVLLRGAHELQLTDEERASVSKVEEGFVSSDGGVPRPVMASFLSDLTAGIRAGKLDSAKLEADYAEIDMALAAIQANEVTTIGALHGILSPAERHALTAAVRARRPIRERIEAPSWDGGAPDWAKVRVERLTRELSLDVDGGQQAKVQALVVASDKGDPLGAAAVGSGRDEGKRRFESILTAFEADVLNAPSLPLEPPGKSAHEGPARAAAFYAQLLPLLKPEQREKLAVGIGLQRVGGGPGRFPEDGPSTGFEGFADEIGAPAPLGPLPK